MQKRRRLLLIMNPRSGGMLAPKYLSEIVERFSRGGLLGSDRENSLGYIVMLKKMQGKSKA